MLESTEISLLIIEERELKDIIIGVPHHAPAGIDKLPCPEHPMSDENTGFLGRYIAEKLDCCSIIACNYRIDVNKYFRSDYTMQVAMWNPKYLLEIHGYGGNKSKYDIEISSGNSENDTHSKKLASKLSIKFANDSELKKITTCGEYDKLYFKAQKSVTINDGRWIPLHLELSPRLRKPDNDKSGKPSLLGYKFCDQLVESLNEILNIS